MRPAGDPRAVAGAARQFWFHGPDFAGKEADLRVEERRRNPKLDRWSVAEKVGESWKDLAALEYRRMPGS